MCIVYDLVNTTSDLCEVRALCSLIIPHADAERDVIRQTSQQSDVGELCADDDAGQVSMQVPLIVAVAAVVIKPVIFLVMNL